GGRSSFGPKAMALEEPINNRMPAPIQNQALKRKVDWVLPRMTVHYTKRFDLMMTHIDTSRRKVPVPFSETSRSERFAELPRTSHRKDPCYSLSVVIACSCTERILTMRFPRVS